jgi:hypothetical protein
MAMVHVRGAETLLIHQVAMEWFENGAHFPLRPTAVLCQFFDAFPLSLTGMPASIASIEKFAMLLAHVFVVPHAVFDLQITFPSSLDPYVGGWQKETPFSDILPSPSWRRPHQGLKETFYQRLSAR